MSVLPAPASCSTERLYAAALRGEHVAVVDGDDRRHSLPVARWTTADEGDRRLLAACAGATLDVGCGPGRMTHGLTATGGTAVGIDVSHEAVRQTRARGATAVRRDVYGRVRGVGRWDTVLLADGNIGIGGDPVRLLRRAHDLLGVRGRVVVDLGRPGGRHAVVEYRLAGAGLLSEPFAWAHVPADAITPLAEAAGFTVVRHLTSSGRWAAVLLKDVPDAA